VIARFNNGHSIEILPMVSTPIEVAVRHFCYLITLLSSCHLFAQLSEGLYSAPLPSFSRPESGTESEPKRTRGGITLAFLQAVYQNLYQPASPIISLLFHHLLAIVNILTRTIYSSFFTNFPRYASTIPPTLLKIFVNG